MLCPPDWAAVAQFLFTVLVSIAFTLPIAGILLNIERKKEK